MAVDWTEERVETLTNMWLSGSTARQIAEVLGDGVTRNAVIGKANRLGLSKPSKSSETRRQRRTEVKQAVLEMPEGGATILTLTSSTCRWRVFLRHSGPGLQSFSPTCLRAGRTSRLR